MLQAEQYGTSVSKAIRVLSDESREARMATAEQKAAIPAAQLTVPMILFLLPPLFVIILGPAFLSIPGINYSSAAVVNGYWRRGTSAFLNW